MASESIDEDLPNSQAPGSLIGGKYELLNTLGSGGMGVVCAARHVKSGKRVALKFIKGETNDPELPKRLLREAKAAASVKHPNVVEIIEVLENENGSPLIVMELLQGETLREVLRRKRRLSLEETARYLLPVASAVGTAHARGIVHRDLKPDNIFLSREPGGAEPDVVKVLDFGIAKVTRLDGHTTESLGLTGTGEILGTPSYMSPEQIFGERDVDQRADIWALGVILYECLVGLPPTNGSNVGQVLKLIVAGGIRPLDVVVPGTPPEIVELVNRMLSRNRDSRPSDLREVVTLLGRYASVATPSFHTANIRSTPGPSRARGDLERLVLGFADVSPDAETVGSGPHASIDEMAVTQLADDTFRQLVSVRSLPAESKHRRRLTTVLALAALALPVAIVGAVRPGSDPPAAAPPPAPAAQPIVVAAPVTEAKPAAPRTEPATLPAPVASVAENQGASPPKKVRSVQRAPAAPPKAPAPAAEPPAAERPALPIFEKPPF